MRECEHRQNLMRHGNYELVLGEELDLAFKWSIVYAGNATDFMLTNEHDDNSSLFLDILLLLLVIFTFPFSQE